MCCKDTFAAGFARCVLKNGNDVFAFFTNCIPDCQTAHSQVPGYRSLESGRTIRSEPSLIGVCLGIVWASL